MIRINNLEIKVGSRKLASDLVLAYDSKYNFPDKIIISYKIKTKTRKYTLMCIRYMYASH
jgi:hypothetical protein